jgi:hypothetical protein
VRLTLFKRVICSLAVLAGATFVVAPAQPAAAAACSGSSGVTVVVQFPDHTSVGCASGDPSSGTSALETAGFAPEHAPNGIICQLNNTPSNPAACHANPNYWVYFHASPGGAWRFSSVGPDSYNPAPGSVEGWRFESGSAGPTTRAPGTPASTPKPTPTHKPPAATHRATPTVTATAATSAPASASPTATASGTPTTPAKPTKAPVATATPLADGAVSASSTPSLTDTSTPTPAAAHDSNGGSISWIWGLLLVVALAAAGGVTALLRRRA